MKGLCACVLLILAHSSLGQAGGPASYGMHELITAPADNQSLAIARLGEGRARALVTLNATKAEERTLSLYEFGNGGLGPRPSLTRALPEEVIFADTGNLGDEEILVLFTAREAIRYEPKRDRLTPLVRYRSIYNLPFPDRVPMRDFFRDINGDGLDDFLIPGFEGLSVFLQEAGGTFGEPLPVDAPPAAEAMGQSVTYRMAPYFVAPLPGNRPSIVTANEQGLYLHPGTAGGGFEAEAVLLSASPPFDYPSLAEMENDMEINQSDFEARALFDAADYDGDGLMDLMVQRVASGGVFDKTTTFELYRGTAASGEVEFSAPPAATLVSKGQLFGFEQKDINGDGQTDMQLIAAEIGIGRIIKALLTGSINVELTFHLMQEGRYPQRPDLRRDIKVDFDLGSGRVSVPVTLSRDLNGDGREDLIVQTGEDRLEIFPGTGGREIFSRESTRLDVDLPSTLDNEASLAQNFIHFADIDGDGFMDLLIHHQRKPPREGKIVVLLSGGGAAR